MDSSNLSQAAPSNGASNASDFQPPTQNPQTAPVNVQQQSGLQNITNPQEFLNERQNVRISVATEPAPAKAAVEPTNDALGIVVLLIIAIAAAVLVYKIVNRQTTNLQTPLEPEPEADTEPKTPKPVESKPITKTKKTEAKRRASKKAKRRRK